MVPPRGSGSSGGRQTILEEGAPGRLPDTARNALITLQVESSMEMQMAAEKTGSQEKQHFECSQKLQDDTIAILRTDLSRARTALDKLKEEQSHADQLHSETTRLLERTDALGEMGRRTLDALHKVHSHMTRHRHRQMDAVREEVRQALDALGWEKRVLQKRLMAAEKTHEMRHEDHSRVKFESVKMRRMVKEVKRAADDSRRNLEVARRTAEEIDILSIAAMDQLRLESDEPQGRMDDALDDASPRLSAAPDPQGLVPVLHLTRGRPSGSAMFPNYQSRIGPPFRSSPLSAISASEILSPAFLFSSAFGTSLPPPIEFPSSTEIGARQPYIIPQTLSPPIIGESQMQTLESKLAALELEYESLVSGDKEEEEGIGGGSACPAVEDDSVGKMPKD
ncbi:MAG: hypothetical protein M1818_005833 [Claussenomyces sp. TS43310]|nr:MAG: hypothetical protein M1818_005833 [Claussenomyces sp. TS43310]